MQQDGQVGSRRAKGSRLTAVLSICMCASLIGAGVLWLAMGQYPGSNEIHNGHEVAPNHPPTNDARDPIGQVDTMAVRLVYPADLKPNPRLMVQAVLRSGAIVSVPSNGREHVLLPAGNYDSATIFAFEELAGSRDEVPILGTLPLVLPEKPGSSCTLQVVMFATVDVTVTRNGRPPDGPVLIYPQIESVEKADSWVLVAGAAGWIPEDRQFQTGVDGKARLRGMPVDSVIRITAIDGMEVADSGPVTVVWSTQVSLALSGTNSPLHLRVKTRNGVPISAVTFAYKVFEESSKVELRSAVATSDGFGLAVIPRSADELVVLAGIRAPEWHSGFETLAVESSVSTQDIVLNRSSKWRLRIMYADGEPYTGPIIISCELFTLSVGFSATNPKGSGFPPTGDGYFDVEGVAADIGSQVDVLPQRAGYAPHTFSISASEASRPYHELVIPPADSNSASGTLRFETPRAAIRAVARILSAESGAVLATVSVTGPTTMVVRVGTYRIEVAGSDVRWDGSLISVLSGRDTVVLLETSPSCRLRARVTDEQGQPLAGAILEPASSTIPVFPEQREEFLVAISNEGGEVTLDGQPQGTREYRLEAAGFEPKLVRVTVPTGGESDLGIIALIRATGSIKVTLELDQPLSDSSIHIQLMQPSSRRISLEMQPFVGKTHEFANLVTGRTYIVVICDSTGSSLRIVNDVRLSTKSPSAEVRIRASELTRD